MPVTVRLPTHALLPVIAALALSGPVLAEDVQVTRYDTAQHLLCKRGDKVLLDRNPVFRLKVSKTAMTEEFSYRDGRIGARKGKFRLRPGGEVSCTITPAEGEAAKPYREFEGLHRLSCKDNGIPIVQPIIAEGLIERGTETTLVYEYRIFEGPPSKQKVVLSADGGDCFINPMD